MAALHLALCNLPAGAGVEVEVNALDIFVTHHPDFSVACLVLIAVVAWAFGQSVLAVVAFLARRK